MTWKTNHLRFGDNTAHLWPDTSTNEGEPAFCGHNFKAHHGTLMSVKRAGLGDTIREVLDHEDVCEECARAVVKRTNMERE